MPYVQSQISELQKKKLQDQQNGVDISGTSTTFNQSQDSQPSAPKPVSNSGSWVNLQSYLDANKENSAAMSTKITGDINTSADNAQTGINNIQAPDAVGAKTKEELNTSFYNNPMADKTAYKAFKSTGGNNGPTNIDGVANWTDTASQTNKAAQQVDNSRTEDGRKTLLQDAYKRPQYTAGAKSLDNLLLQNDTTAKQKFEDLGTKWSGLTNLLDDKQTALNERIGSNTANAYANKSLIPQAETDARNAIVNPIQTRADGLNASNAGLISRVGADLSDDTLSDETLALLGLGDGQSLYDLNLSGYVTPDNTPVGLDNAATPEERAKYAALAGLIDDPTMTQVTANGKAINPLSFNKNQFDTDLAARGAGYNQAMNDNRFTGNGSSVSYEGKQIKDMSLTELKQALPAMKQLQGQNEQAYNESAAQGQPMFFQNLPIADIEAAINNVSNVYKSNRRIGRG